MVRIRRDMQNVSPSEWDTYADAILTLMDRRIWQHGAEVHITAMLNGSAHQGPAFVPWHEAYLLWLEDELMRVNGNIPGLLYFNPRRADFMNVWTDAYLGSTGNPARDYQIYDGPFLNYHPRQYDPATRTFYDSDLVLTQAILRDGRFHTQGDVDAVMKQTAYDVSPWNANSASGARNILEGWRGPNLHNEDHIAEAEINATAGSANSPSFPKKHGMHSKIFHQWARNRIKRLPAGKRQFWRLYRPVTGGPSGHNLNDPMRDLPGRNWTPKQVLTFVQAEVRYQ